MAIGYLNIVKNAKIKIKQIFIWVFASTCGTKLSHKNTKISYNQQGLQV